MFLVLDLKQCPNIEGNACTRAVKGTAARCFHHNGINLCLQCSWRFLFPGSLHCHVTAYAFSSPACELHFIAEPLVAEVSNPPVLTPCFTGSPPFSRNWQVTSTWTIFVPSRRTEALAVRYFPCPTYSDRSLAPCPGFVNSELLSFPLPRSLTILKTQPKKATNQGCKKWLEIDFSLHLFGKRAGFVSKKSLKKKCVTSVAAGWEQHEDLFQYFTREQWSCCHQLKKCTAFFPPGRILFQIIFVLRVAMCFSNFGAHFCCITLSWLLCGLSQEHVWNNAGSFSDVLFGKCERKMFLLLVLCTLLNHRY